MDKHLLWLWFWFGVGMFVYMLKRAYYLVTGSNPVANTYTEFIKRCWIPLLVRAVVDSGIYWATFTPQMLQHMLASLGWTNFAAGIADVSSNGFFALFFGLGVDSIVDFAVTKIPWIKDWWPQMPPPLVIPDEIKKQLEAEKSAGK